MSIPHEMTLETDLTEELIRAATPLLEKQLSRKQAGVRLPEMGVGHPESGELYQGGLFAEERTERQSPIEAVSDRIRDKFGDGALRRGAGNHPGPIGGR
jgi:DNA polymerase IV